jgi:hypothetical protein
LRAEAAVERDAREKEAREAEAAAVQQAVAMAAAEAEYAGERRAAGWGQELRQAQVETAEVAEAARREVVAVRAAAERTLLEVQARHRAELKGARTAQLAEAEGRAELRLAAVKRDAAAARSLERAQYDGRLVELQTALMEKVVSLEASSEKRVADRLAAVELESSEALHATWAELEGANKLLASAKQIADRVARPDAARRPRCRAVAAGPPLGRRPSSSTSRPDASSGGGDTPRRTASTLVKVRWLPRPWAAELRARSLSRPSCPRVDSFAHGRATTQLARLGPAQRSGPRPLAVGRGTLPMPTPPSTFDLTESCITGRLR